MNEENSEIVLITRDDYRRINNPQCEIHNVRIYRPRVLVQLTKTPQSKRSL